MKLSELRKTIREEVKNAIREELQDILVEAVSIASKPDEEDLQVKETPIEESVKQYTAQPGMSMLEQTKMEMTQQDYANASNGGNKPNLASSAASQLGMSEGISPSGAGIDISNLDFVKKGKAVNKAVIAKDLLKTP